MNETGWRVGASSAWLWVAATEDATASQQASTPSTTSPATPEHQTGAHTPLHLKARQPTRSFASTHLDTPAIQVPVSFLTGNFTLRSGRLATKYFDKHQVESRPELLGPICEALARLVPADTDVLAGLDLGGIPIATHLSRITDREALLAEGINLFLLVTASQLEEAVK